MDAVAVGARSSRRKRAWDYARFPGSRGLIRIPTGIRVSVSASASAPVDTPGRLRPKRGKQDHQHEDERPPTCSVSTHEREAPIVIQNSPDPPWTWGPGSPVRSVAGDSQRGGGMPSFETLKTRVLA